VTGQDCVRAAAAMFACVCALIAAFAAPAHLGGVTSAWAQSSPAEAARPPVSIAVFVSSRTDACFDTGEVAAIRKLAAQEVERLNKSGGIAGRPIRIRVLDDRREDYLAIAHVREAISDPSMLAIVGLSGTNRGKAVFDALSHEIKQSAVPFITALTLTSLFQEHPNVFTMRASQEQERIPTLVQFVVHSGARRPGFIGLSSALLSQAMREGLERALGDGAMVIDRGLALKDNRLDPAEVDAAVREVKERSPDLLFLSVGSQRTADILRRLLSANATPPVFLTGRLAGLPPDLLKAWPNDIYELAWDSIPEVSNERLRQRISRAAPQDWSFEGRRNEEAPGWRTGGCKARPAEEKPDLLRPANLRAIEIGTQYADIVGLVAEAAKGAPSGSDAAQLRAHVIEKLGTSFAAGRGAFKGSFENWSFHPQSRAAARSPFIVVQPKGLGRVQLAPIQFARAKDSMRRLETLYLDIDMIRTHRVDDNEKSSYADFYVSMRSSASATIDQIDFTNAFLDPKTNDRQLTVRTLHGGGRSDIYPEGMRIYQVSGRFTFEPRLQTYPFDTQRFSIDIQPKKGDAAFIIQPPPAELRDQQMSTDGWDVIGQYVGTDEDFVPIIDARTLEPSVVPFYKASFVSEMRRQTTDYFLRVVIPLGFILLVAYLSIFIPMSHFEAIITLQVTALLSAVALYLSLPKLDADTATLSDRIFLFDYMLVSLMVGISILRISGFVGKRLWLRRLLGLAHMVLIPLLIAGAAWYVWTMSLADG